MARLIPDWTIEGVGSLEGAVQTHQPTNLILHGPLNDPRRVIDHCEVVISNAIHNTVMEMAALHKRFIVVPKPRPFDEQRVKAALLARLGLAYVVDPAQLYLTDWATLLAGVRKKSAHWNGIVDEQAGSRATRAIRNVYTSRHTTGPASV